MDEDARTRILGRASILDVDEPAAVEVHVEPGLDDGFVRDAALGLGEERGLAQQPPEQVRRVARNVQGPPLGHEIH